MSIFFSPSLAWSKYLYLFVSDCAIVYRHFNKYGHKFAVDRWWKCGRKYPKRFFKLNNNSFIGHAELSISLWCIVESQWSRLSRCNYYNWVRSWNQTWFFFLYILKHDRIHKLSKEEKKTDQLEIRFFLFFTFIHFGELEISDGRWRRSVVWGWSLITQHST